MKELAVKMRSAPMQKRFEDVSDLDFQKEVGFAIQALSENTYLQKASHESILKSVYNVALTGLTLNPVLKQAYLIPRNIKGVVTCTLLPSYQGLISKMIDTGQALDVYSMVVYENDEFLINFGTEKKIEKHVPYYVLGKESGKEIAVYAVAILPSGLKKFELLPMKKVEAIMQRSDAYKSDVKNNTSNSPWKNEFRGDMIKKVAIKHLFNYMPKNQSTQEVANLIDLDNENSGYQFTKEPINVDKKALTNVETIYDSQPTNEPNDDNRE